MPNIIKSFSLRRSSSAEKLLYIEAEYDRARMHMDKAFQRSYENWRMYFGIEYGQWWADDITRLNSEKRHPEQYNIVQPKVDTLAGAIASEKYEMDLRPIEGRRNSLIEAERDSFYADKELCNFEWSIGQVIKDAMVHSGELKMTKVFDKTPHFGNIAFQREQPGYVVRDPNWTSNDDKDCRKLWEIFFMTAEQVSQVYGIESQQIRNEIMLSGMHGHDYEEPEMDFTQKISRSYYGSLHRVIEFHWMEKIKVKRLQGQKVDAVNWVPFPITKDENVLEEFIVRNQIDPNTLQEVDYEDDIHMVSAICPTLVIDKVMTEGPGLMQPKRLPYYHLAANREMGMDKGIVDDIADSQRTINRNQVKISDLIATATGGGKLFARGLFKTPEEIQEFKDRANDPSYNKDVDDDALRDNPIHYLNTNQYPSTLIKQFESMWEITDRVSKVPAAMEAMSQSTNESGILFERKLQVARLGLITVNTNVLKWRHDIAEGYYWQWQIDPGYNSVEREQSTRDGRHRVILNERVFKDGKWFVRNIPSQIPRSTVMITESKYSPNKILKDRALFQDLYNSAIQQNPNSIYTSWFFGKILDTMELNEQDRSELDMIKDLQQKLDLARIETEQSGLEANKQQSILASIQALMERQRLTGGEEQQEEIPISEIPEEDFNAQGGGGGPIDLSQQERPELLATE